MPRKLDFTPDGLKLEGPYENDRNAENRDCFKAVIREVYGVQDVIIAHHLTYVREEQRTEGGITSTYQIVEEIPSADALIFDHEVAKKLWGDVWQHRLQELACEPAETRDTLFTSLFNARGKGNGTV